VAVACVTFTAAAETPRRYVCRRAETAIRIDGKLDEPAWKKAPWTEAFIDIAGPERPKPRFRTRVKMLWDSGSFYVGAYLDEPHVWATLTAHDSVIFRDNDFEVFADPDGDGLNYFEFEINALNTGWDLFLPRPYKDGGKADNSWEIPGLRTAVSVAGTLNDPADRDRGWSIEMAFPWEAFAHQGYKAARPEPGAEWRVNFSRVEWRTRIAGGKYEKIPRQAEDNWVWSPQGKVNMHIPEKWGVVRFER
jgi:hypothetical protein